MSFGFLDLLTQATNDPAQVREIWVKRVRTANMQKSYHTASTLRRCHNLAMANQRVFIQTADFDLSKEVAALRTGDMRVGAVCSFVGTVRDRNEAPTLATARAALPPEGANFPKGGLSENCSDVGKISSLELEHYPGMTEKSIEAMIDAAHQRFDIFGARVIHRIGLLQPLDQIVMVAVTSAHRGESYKACEFLMDYLKTQAPFWKKEQTPDGAKWVDARVSDDAALLRWGIGNAQSNLGIGTQLS